MNDLISKQAELKLLLYKKDRLQEPLIGSNHISQDKQCSLQDSESEMEHTDTQILPINDGHSAHGAKVRHSSALFPYFVSQPVHSST
jgi:hypothetical protein